MEAARQLERQFRASKAEPHATVVIPMATALRLTAAQAAATGQIFDLLQTAIDIADNIADVDEDDAAGRTVSYPGIPPAALVCLPGLLVGAALSILTRAFNEARFHASYSCQRVLRILGDMVIGQALSKGTVRHDRLVSGRQGVLLCLPFWLASKRSTVWRRRLPALERWAFLFGLTWEAHERQIDSTTPQTITAYRKSIRAVRHAWPDFFPFGAGDSLSVGNFLREGVC